MPRNIYKKEYPKLKLDAKGHCEIVKPRVRADYCDNAGYFGDIRLSRNDNGTINLSLKDYQVNINLELNLIDVENIAAYLNTYLKIIENKWIKYHEK